MAKPTRLLKHGVEIGLYPTKKLAVAEGKRLCKMFKQGRLDPHLNSIVVSYEFV